MRVFLQIGLLPDSDLVGLEFVEKRSVADVEQLRRMSPIAVRSQEGSANRLGFRTLPTGLQVEVPCRGVCFAACSGIKEIQGQVSGGDAVGFAAAHGEPHDGF